MCQLFEAKDRLVYPQMYLIKNKDIENASRGFMVISGSIVWPTPKNIWGEIMAKIGTLKVQPITLTIWTIFLWSRFDFSWANSNINQ